MSNLYLCLIAGRRRGKDSAAIVTHQGAVVAEVTLAEGVDAEQLAGLVESGQVMLSDVKEPRKPMKAPREEAKPEKAAKPKSTGKPTGKPKGPPVTEPDEKSGEAAGDPDAAGENTGAGETAPTP